jgi:hypothetical protein
VAVVAGAGHRESSSGCLALAQRAVLPLGSARGTGRLRLVAEDLGREVGGVQELGDEVKVIDLALLVGVVDVAVAQLGGTVEWVEVEIETVDDLADDVLQDGLGRLVTSSTAGSSGAGFE